MQIELPYPPTVNHYWRHTRNGHYISAEGVNYRSLVHQIIHKRAARPLLAGRLAASIEVYPPDNRRRDLDNVLKATLDALQHGGAYVDDEQIDDLRIMRREKTPGGMIRVTLAEV